jgi:hypothetical protein
MPVFKKIAPWLKAHPGRKREDFPDLSQKMEKDCLKNTEITLAG